MPILASGTYTARLAGVSSLPDASGSRTFEIFPLHFTLWCVWAAILVLWYGAFWRKDRKGYGSGLLLAPCLGLLGMALAASSRDGTILGLPLQALAFAFLLQRQEPRLRLRNSLLVIYGAGLLTAALNLFMYGGFQYMTALLCLLFIPIFIGGGIIAVPFLSLRLAIQEQVVPRRLWIGFLVGAVLPAAFVSAVLIAYASVYEQSFWQFHVYNLIYWLLPALLYCLMVLRIDWARDLMTGKLKMDLGMSDEKPVAK